MKDKWQRRITIFSVAFHFLSLPVLFALGVLALSVSRSLIEIMLVLLCLGWIPVASLTLLWLGWQERKRLQNTMVLVAVNLFFVLLLLGGQSHAVVVSLAAGMYFGPFLFLLFELDFLYAIQRHVGLSLLAGGSLVWIWSIVLEWHILGNPLMMFLDNPEQLSGALLWLSAATYLTGAMVLAGLVAVVVEMFRQVFYLLNFCQ